MFRSYQENLQIIEQNKKDLERLIADHQVLYKKDPWIYYLLYPSVALAKYLHRLHEESLSHES